MFPFDRYGIVHFVRVGLEILLIILMYIFGGCHSGMIFGFDPFTALLFSISVIVCVSMDVYLLLLSFFIPLTPKRSAGFHIVLYSLLVMVFMCLAVFCIIGFIYCRNGRFIRQCKTSTDCTTLWAGIVLSFFLSVAYGISAGLLCCTKQEYSDERS
ncbi:unnamed protein product [Didymodactylos carnosus]|uniref:MARVEL domain-containing protein n=1 Tax=Didymodactylos carnosus TaxID=1234261 RepID=A0A8S2CZN9_9BILA|nr:unnamed protein product [Didymodactylos carnosus]CAF3593846.1 unnamed protein product [Didymodactylos carnosus]